jgi:hypothetical protein
LETDEEDAEDGVGGSFNTAFCNYDIGNEDMGLNLEGLGWNQFK